MMRKVQCPINPYHKDVEIVYESKDGKAIGIRCPHPHFPSEAFGKTPQGPEKAKSNMVFLIEK